MVRELDGSRHPLVVGVPGDREVDAKRLAAQLEPAEAEPFGEADFAAYPVLVKGYIGPAVLGEESASGIRYLVDPRVVEGTRWVTGANEPGRHVFDLVCGRDFTPDGVLDVAAIREGDPAPDGSGPLRLARGIEMGHIFQLGRKYRRGARAAGARPERQAGHRHHGLLRRRGVPRGGRRRRGHLRRQGAVLAARAGPVRRAAAGHRQGRGGDRGRAADLAVQLDEAGVSVLLDDRKASPGVKFADAEIMGMPTIVVVGRGLADGVIEVRDRRTDERREVPVADALGEIVAAVHGRPALD